MGIDSSVGRQSNERDAVFARFYKTELPGQIRSATLILGSHAAACDAVQDAFTKVLHGWAQIDEPGPYLQKCVINRCRDLMRRQRVADRKRHLLAPSDIPDVDVPLFDALARLPFNHRAAVVLRFYLQLTEAEIAGHLGCASGSVGPWIRRGLDQLARDIRLPTEERQ
jgi:DNA-directed RNA polymerase specialized sigma24 family protein